MTFCDDDMMSLFLRSLNILNHILGSRQDYFFSSALHLKRTNLTESDMAQLLLPWGKAVMKWWALASTAALSSSSCSPQVRAVAGYTAHYYTPWRTQQAVVAVSSWNKYREDKPIVAGKVTNNSLRHSLNFFRYQLRLRYNWKKSNSLM